ncbi:cytochrome c biogenesis protein DipZ [Kineosporia mesophila]|uniref:Cytochrome c biogenesis protein DipZ n=1 Tax=Kineosporia mesophila TaxID=566012 RepID=A0ABP7AMD6_9ACTN|nr:MarC family protein [Kineosporia mesophila]MCD5353968.1 redoxin domain-containing protein [Kineosporia mesophila]
MITLISIGLVGGLITGVSPCILPMLPILFFAGGAGTADDEAKKPKQRPLKIILGLIASFTVFTLAGSVILSALGLPQTFLRWAGVIVLAAVGIGLLFPKVEELLQRPFNRMPKIQGKMHGNPFIFGLTLGTLYVPCAGPVLAAITVAGATGSVGAETVALTLAFATGAAIPLLVFATAGDRIRDRLAAYRSRAATFRIVGGTSMVVLAVALALGATDALQRAVPDYTGNLQNTIAESDAVKGVLSGLSDAGNSELSQCTPGATQLESCGTAPDITGITKWLNTPAGSGVKLESLRGHPVLIDFWAYSCINCQRSLPHVVAWDKAYREAGLRVIGIHAPEFAFEKSAGNVAGAAKKMGITYPVALDNSLSTWTNYRNRYWPAEYLIDASGTVRNIKFGEGDYGATETMIRQLLTAANPGVSLPAASNLPDTRPTTADITPETYFAYSRSTNYQGEKSLTPVTAAPFTLPATQNQDTYSLGGTWTISTQYVEAVRDSRLRLAYRAKNVYMVLGGTGTLRIDVPGQATRTVEVTGAPTLYPILANAQQQAGQVTVTAGEGVRLYTATFG